MGQHLLMTQPSQAAPQPATATRILTVEDDERIRTAVRLALEEEGWVVAETANGEQALESFITNGADVVLIDIMLPGIDGFEVCRSIRRLGDVPIIMVTARSDSHDVVAGLEAGADDYLRKPFDPKELSARIRALLRRSRSDESRPTRIEVGGLEILADEGATVEAGGKLAVMSGGSGAGGGTDGAVEAPAPNSASAAEPTTSGRNDVEDAPSVMAYVGERFRGIDPQRTVTCSPLGAADFKVEIEVTAYRGASKAEVEEITISL